eukprot:1158867-Pelagomonas_calceolata.AAC.25
MQNVKCSLNHRWSIAKCDDTKLLDKCETQLTDFQGWFCRSARPVHAVLDVGRFHNATLCCSLVWTCFKGTSQTTATKLWVTWAWLDVHVVILFPRARAVAKACVVSMWLNQPVAVYAAGSYSPIRASQGFSGVHANENRITWALPRSHRSAWPMMHEKENKEQTTHASSDCVWSKGSLTSKQAPPMTHRICSVWQSVPFSPDAFADIMAFSAPARLVRPRVCRTV